MAYTLSRPKHLLLFLIYGCKRPAYRNEKEKRHNSCNLYHANENRYNACLLITHWNIHIIIVLAYILRLPLMPHRVITSPETCTKNFHVHSTVIINGDTTVETLRATVNLFPGPHDISPEPASDLSLSTSTLQKLHNFLSQRFLHCECIEMHGMRSQRQVNKLLILITFLQFFMAIAIFTETINGITTCNTSSATFSDFVVK